MKVLKFDLENCYGIKKMQHEINFSKNNVAIIYAPNGMMKSSLAKTFQDIRDGKEIKEKIFGKKSTCNILCEDNSELEKNKIIVINPFDENLCEDQGLLMANDSLRKEYLDVHNVINSKKIELFSKIKNKIAKNNKSFDVKIKLQEDWKFSIEFDCLDKIYTLINEPSMECALSEEDIDYLYLFSEAVCKKFSESEMIEKVIQFEEKYTELVSKSPYMQQGIIDHNNYTSIEKSLKDNKFFDVKNEIVLIPKNGGEKKVLRSSKELNQLIKNETEKILESDEIKNIFEKINKDFTKNKELKSFLLFLQSHKEIISEYKDINKFKKKIWVKCFQPFESELKELLNEFKNAKAKLNELRIKAKNENTEWGKALEQFKRRFFVPFKIEASNQDDVILNQELPSFKYIFEDKDEKKEVTKENLLDVLSTGERRAYYILNMIFQILIAEKEEEESLIILDDISDSFDYMNKYAIIEYIYDISEYLNKNGEKKFKILLLTHNFDFYRNVGKKFNIRENTFIAYKDEESIKLNNGNYLKDIFSFYIKSLLSKKNDKIMVVIISFVRNLIGYIDEKINENEDYLKLTSLLHFKKDTKKITIKEIENIFNKYLSTYKKFNFADGREEKLMYEIIIEECEKISDEEAIEIENKILLSIGIRLKSEIYMLKKLKIINEKEEILMDIPYSSNQTSKILKDYTEKIGVENLRLLETASMVSSENIHINSFMFEPILDMSLKYLYNTYANLKKI